MGTDLVGRLWMKIIAPATAYAIDHSVSDDVRRRQWTDRPTSVFGPGCPPGGRAPTDEELARLGRLHGRLRGTEADAPAPADPTVLSHAVDQLLARGAAAVSFGTGEHRARIVRFWHGDDMLHMTTTRLGDASTSMSRIPRHLTAQQRRDLLTGYLGRG